MTTVSSVSSTSGAYTNIVGANTAMNLLLTGSNGLANQLATHPTSNAPPTTTQISSALWSLIDTQNTSTISLPDLQNAVKAQGGQSTNAYALWNQINPSGTYTMSFSQFSSSFYLNNSINANLTTIQQNVAKALLLNSTTVSATASKTAKSLLTSPNMTNMLAMQSSASTPPSASQVSSTLWSVINPNNAPSISLASLAHAVTTAGGKSSDAYALWTQINPGASHTMSATQFKNSAFLKRAIGTNMVTIQKNVATTLAHNPFTAEKTIQMIMNSPDIIKSLASNSTRWTLPSTSQVFSTIWALFNVNSTKVITKADVQAGVNAEGGSPADANALWKKLDPNNTGAVGAAQFINNAYLQDAIQVNLPNTQATVSNALLLNNGSSNTVLDSFSKGGSDVLATAANGYNGSPVGTGNNTSYINLFV